MPNRENIRKWVDALRSGEFKQARKALRTSDGFCCLGVACEVYRRETGRGAWVALAPDEKNMMTFFGHSGVSSDSELTGDVAEWLFNDKYLLLPDATNPEWAEADDEAREWTPERMELAVANDDGKDFVFIANAIEREYLTEGEG